MAFKDNGLLSGLVTRGGASLDLEEAIQTVFAEESLVCDVQGEKVVFVASLDVENGGLCFLPTQEGQKVLERTVAMSQMTSMLRDCDRNRIYEAAIERMISYHGMTVKVLDIGAGTGLLGMFCVRYMAKEVVGFEMFDEMAQIAKEVVEKNGLNDKIMIVNGKSTDIDLDEGSLADILVSELLDSALLGESCMYSHGDAISRLMKHDGNIDIQNRVIPHSGEIYGMLIQSDTVNKMHNIKEIPLNKLSGISPFRDEDAENCCSGYSAVLPIHWNKLKNIDGIVLSDKYKLDTVEFFHGLLDEKKEIKENFGYNTTTIDMTVEVDGTVDAILIYWKVFLLSPELDPSREMFYTTEPDVMNWQDHWTQVIYPLPNSIEVKKNQILRVNFARDSIHMWMNVHIINDIKRLKLEEIRLDDEWQEHQCQCGWHVLINADRCLQLNDNRRSDIWYKALNDLKNILTFRNDFNIILNLGDGSLLSLTLGRMLLENKKIKIISKEVKPLSHFFYNQLLFENDLTDNVVLWDGSDVSNLIDECSNDEIEGDNNLMNPINVLVSECYHTQLQALPTWDALSFYYERKSLHLLLSNDVIILPKKAYVYCMAVHLKDLHLSHGLIHNVNGFDLSPLDERQKKWSDYYYPYKLALYDRTYLSKPLCIAELDYITMNDEILLTSIIDINKAGVCHCIVIWVDYDLSLDKSLIIDHYNQDENHDFPLYYRHNLKFFHDPIVVTESNKLKCETKFNDGDKDFTFTFTII